MDPSTPLEQRPYMQRPGGSPDGSDLKAKGLVGVGLGAAQKKIDVDAKYEKLEKEGKLKSTNFQVPWTNAAAAKIKADAIAENVKKTAAINPSKSKTPVNNKSGSVTPPPKAEPEKKKGFFGLF